VEAILKEGYKIPVKMTTAERSTRYRERNNQSAHENMDFVRKEVARLLADGQVVESILPPLCTNPLTVASKVNPDGTIEQRLVIDLSRWVNKFISPDRYTMERFQDALALSSRGDYQSLFDVSKAYHHLRLAPESYALICFCVVGEDGKERLYHFVVVVFGLGPAGQALGRVMRPVLSFLSKMGIRNLMYVDYGFVVAATKALADSN
jgi:hypothetical protein